MITHWGETGAIAPSSKHLAHCIVEQADLTRARCVVELGPGTGVFTEQIVQKITKTTQFFCIEIQKTMAESTRLKCPDVTVHEDCGSRLPHYLALNGQTHCDRVVSGLPWAIFDGDLQIQLLDAISNSLAPGGTFVTFTYLTALILPGSRRFYRLAHERFSQVNKSNICWRNLPPALIYTCTK